MGGGDPQDGEGLGDVLFEPGGELRSGLLVTGGDVPKAPLGLEVEPVALKRTLAGVERVWRAIESGVGWVSG